VYLKEHEIGAEPVSYENGVSVHEGQDVLSHLLPRLCYTFQVRLPDAAPAETSGRQGLLSVSSAV